MSIRRENRTQFKEKVKQRSVKKINISCDNCNSDIPSSNININNSLAKCENCQSIFNIKDDIFFHVDRVGRPEMIMPEGTDVLPLNDALDIRINWLKSKPKSSYLFLTFFTVLWNGILAFMATSFLAAGAISSILFMSIHLLVGLGLIYYLAGVYLNYTDIIITSDFIEISQRPIKNPFSKTQTYSTDNITQLYVHKYVSSTTNGVPDYAYALLATVNNKNAPITLIKGMDSETQLYLEQEIERYLKITDSPISNSITQH